MKAKFRYAGVGLALLGLAVSAAGCRKDLCYDHDAHSPGCRALVSTTRSFNIFSSIFLLLCR